MRAAYTILSMSCYPFSVHEIDYYAAIRLAFRLDSSSIIIAFVHHAHRQCLSVGCHHAVCTACVFLSVAVQNNMNRVQVAMPRLPEGGLVEDVSYTLRSRTSACPANRLTVLQHTCLQTEPVHV